MNLTFLLPLLLIFLSTWAVADDCNHECKQTEYKSYVECLQKRSKRSINCPNATQELNCQNCDCNFCVVNRCPQNCLRCCESTPPCISRSCCHRTCHSRCNTLLCRTSCRRECTEKLLAEGINITAPSRPRHNVTTIIHLSNSINNTNIIDIPINVNNSNINNITSGFDEDEEAEDEQDLTFDNNCCYVYSSKNCSKIDEYPYTKCVRYRKKVCGAVCVAPIVHEQRIRRCASTSAGIFCQERTMYIPQPKPVCSYQNSWPYVTCGMPNTQNCGGCYEHYNSHQLPIGCSYGCYDDGYGVGPYYRKGPFYRPGYSHAPSCYQTGTCSFNWNSNYPIYGGASYPPNSYQPNFMLPTKPSPRPNQTGKANSTSPTYFKIPIYPPHITSGYPYPGPPPIYILPPEVDIQAIITHPEKETNYAQITISKPGMEDKIVDVDDS